MICATLIASIGLILDNVAVIIGAMLISPLMGTIMGMPKVNALTLRQWRRVQIRIRLTTLLAITPFLIMGVYHLIQALAV